MRSRDLRAGLMRLPSRQARCEVTQLRRPITDWMFRTMVVALLVVLTLEMGLISPPVGINVFIVDWYWYENEPCFERQLNEGLIPALESAHAVAHALELLPRLDDDALVVINLSGRGDKDLSEVSLVDGSST